jgi:hypothetical protein
MAFDGSALCQASDAALPFRQREVTLVRLGADLRIQQAYTVADSKNSFDACGRVTGYLRPGPVSTAPTRSG